MSFMVTTALRLENDSLLAGVTNNTRDETIVERLTREGGWTEDGAKELLSLARTYGTSILRNALALASAMRIEDGTRGL